MTPRTWFPHGVSTACGVNLPYLMYQHILGLPVEEQHDFTKGVRWIHEERDLRALVGGWSQGKLRLKEALSSYRGPRTYALAAWDDPGPFLATLGKGLRRSFRLLYSQTARKSLSR